MTNDQKRSEAAERRRATIVLLLEHWLEFFQPASSGRAGTDGDGGGLQLVSAMSRHPSVLELGRCLEALARACPGHYRHVAAFYGAESRTVSRPALKRNHRGKLVQAEPQRVRERVVPAWVLPRMVGRGVDGIAWGGRLVEYGFRGSPELPIALRRGLTGELREFVDPVSGEHGWTEAA